MPHIVVSPLARIAEMAVRHRCREMVSLLARGQDFHRPGVIDAKRHLSLWLNDIPVGSADGLSGPQEEHVSHIIDFSRSWDRSSPLLVHCWMGVSRSPAAAAIAALSVEPDQDDMLLARRLRVSSPFATPNVRLIAIADDLLQRQGRLVKAIRKIGRGADASGDAPFVFHLTTDGEADHAG